MSALTDAVAAFEKTVADLAARVSKLEAAPTPPPVVPPVTPPKPAGKLAAIKLPARGFFSGVAGYGDGSKQNGETTNADLFGTWRGDPVDITGTWQDQENGKADGIHWGWGGDFSPTLARPMLLDLAPGGPSDYAAAAAGSLDAKWRDYLIRVRKQRTIGGIVYPTIIRPCHEPNGDWYLWSVKVGMEANFRATMKRWRKILDEVFPEAIFALCFNGDHSSYPLKVDDLYEAGVWDLIGVDQYNTYPNITTAAQFDAEAGKYKWTGAPRGIEAWRLWAKDRGLPIYHPEFANGGADSDTTAWLTKRYAWARANAGSGPGQFFAEIWFNVQGYGDAYWLTGKTGTNPKTPKTVAAYRDLHPLA